MAINKHFVQNIKIWCEFFRAGFRYSDKKSIFWIPVMNSRSNAANNYRGGAGDYRVVRGPAVMLGQ
jgi:hypothetical protein